MEASETQNGAGTDISMTVEQQARREIERGRFVFG
jgi:hypothetical protein